MSICSNRSSVIICIVPTRISLVNGSLGRSQNLNSLGLCSLHTTCHCAAGCSIAIRPHSIHSIIHSLLFPYILLSKHSCIPYVVHAYGHASQLMRISMTVIECMKAGNEFQYSLRYTTYNTQIASSQPSVCRGGSNSEASRCPQLYTSSIQELHCFYCGVTYSQQRLLWS